MGRHALYESGEGGTWSGPTLRAFPPPAFLLPPFLSPVSSPWSSCARWTTGYTDTLCLLSPCISFSKFLQNRAALLLPRFVKLPRPVQVPVSALIQQALHLQTDTNLHGAMGNLVWHEYARYVSLTATVCEFSSW